VLTTKLIHSMRRDGLTRGLVTLCIGGGQGIALAIETLHLTYRREQGLRHAAAKIHVVEGRYDEARLAKVSGAIQAALMNTLRVPPERLLPADLRAAEEPLPPHAVVCRHALHRRSDQSRTSVSSRAAKRPGLHS